MNINEFFARLFATRKNPYVPGLNQREKVCINISGNELTMELPPHSDYEGFEDEKPPNSINLYEESYFDKESNRPKWQQSGTGYHGIMKRTWELKGKPWVRMPYGRVKFSIVLKKAKTMPETMSCFNPNHFEQLIMREAWFKGPGRYIGSRMKAPVNWKLMHLSGSTGIYFEQHKDLSYFNESSEIDKSLISCYFNLPLTFRHFITLNFHYFGYVPVESSLRNMHMITELVCETTKLTLSQTSIKELTLAKEKWPDAKASPHRDPEPWVYPQTKEVKREDGCIEDVIDIEGSPPPGFSP